MSLKEYNKKRNFLKTSEPKGKISNIDTGKFVVQYHKARANHYDFRIEPNGVLISWAIPKGLSQNPKDKRLAVKVEDHPVDYIDFEGIIPKGNYGAGTVEIFDKGNYLPLENLDKGLKKGHIKILLNGKKLKGGWSLIRIGKEENWLAIKLVDEMAYSSPKKTLNLLPFKSLSPQLATLSSTIPKGKQWIYEIKYDGYRILSFVEKGKSKLYSRNGNDYTKKFNRISLALEKIQEESFVVDGEVVSFDEKGKSDFGLLQKNLKKGEGEFYYVIFDLLALNGQDLRNLPLIERKEKLERLLFDCQNNLIYSQHVEKGKESLLFAKQNNLEGIVAKKISAPYYSGRNEDWLKIKCYHRQEFVIAGFTTSSKNEVLSAILVGYYENEKLIFVGKVGTGFSEEAKKQLREIFDKILVKTSPFKEKIKIKDAYWVKPKYIAEIQFAEFTKDKILRQPSFIGLRNDKNPKDVKLE